MPGAGAEEKSKTVSSAAEQRQFKKDLARLERQIEKARVRITELEQEQSAAAFDPAELSRVTRDLEFARVELSSREEEWLEVTLLLEP
jgi:ATP-binding cassette subfamily F protein uup